MGELARRPLGAYDSVVDARRPIAVALGSIAIAGLGSLLAAIATRDADREPAPIPLVPGPRAHALIAIDAALLQPSPRPYPLDSLERTPALIAAGCPEVPLIDHAGTHATWRPALRIHPAFAPTVEDIERAFVHASRARYGRAPLALLSASSYRCRAIRDRPERPSEHALGNALDVRGIVLAMEDGTSREITVREHWGDGSIDDLFFHDAIRAVIERARVRGVIGPPDPDHLDHFHVDHGPSPFVSIELGP